MIDQGFFGGVAHRYWSVTAEMWGYVRRSHFLTKPVTASVFLLYAPLLLFVAFLFALFIPFDLIDAAIRAIRASLLRFYAQMSQASGDNFFGFLILPSLLLCLAPILLLVIFLPKLGGSDQGS